MRRATDSLAWSALCTFLIAILSLAKIDALLCYCTEDECLSGDRSNMCVQSNPELGCYKQYYSKIEPAITMGCVKASLWCDSSHIRPGPYNSEWPNTACCYTDHCNFDLPLPDVTGSLEEAASPPADTSAPSQSTKQTTEHNASVDSNTTGSESESTVHPVFMLVMVLVYIFLVVVMASILVIVKVWFYKRKNSSRKHWVIERNKLKTKAQMSHLLTDEQYEVPIRSHLSNSNRLVSNFDVP
ncbi:uncharacterized protein [Watersipora subatra]|uniref:uncharacterized protein n=1 Tax=Watersipora subatra TaxID=2589382 RepID=UPI00355C79B1